MSFHLDRNKKTQEVIFYRKRDKPNHPSLILNNLMVIQSTIHKHLGTILDAKLDFYEHLKDKVSEIS